MAAAILTACGGGGGSDAPTPTPTTTTPTPTDAAKGIEGVGIVKSFGPNLESIVINDASYDATDNMLEVIVDGVPATLGDLDVGNVVRVAATTDDDGVTAIATSIEQINDLEGPIEAGSIDTAAGTFVVLGQTVRVVAATLFDDDIMPASLLGLSDEDEVEISGRFDGAGVFVATRVEFDDDAGDFEITGTISNLDTANLRFDINAQTVDYSSATLEDFDSGMLADGDLVEVYGDTINAAGELVAQRVENEAPEFDGDDGDLAELEGYITRFVSATDFDVAGFPVTTTNGTVYEDGTDTDLALGVRVDVEGQLNADAVLVADEIEFEDGEDDSDVEISATVDAVDSAAGTFEVLGLTVVVRAGTIFEDDSDADLAAFGLSDLNVGDFVETVLVSTDQGLEAIVVARDEADDESSVQGPVDMISNPQLSILGVAVETTASTEFEDADETPVSATAFFDLVEVGDIVEATGAWNGTALIAEEVEFED
jgi:hypothetical protein